MRIGVNGRLLLSEKMEGMPRYIYETTLQMSNSHPEDEFYVFFDRNVQVNFGFPNNVKSIIVPWHARHPILWYWWFELMIPLYLWWYNIDVFYSGDGYLSLRTQIPTLMVIHDLAYIHYPEQIQSSSLWHYRRFVPKFLHKADSLVTVSDYVKRDIHRHFQVPEEQIIVAGNAVDRIPELTELDTSNEIQYVAEQKPYFLYVGAIHPRKNIDNLIKGFLLFNKENQYNLVLAGRMAWKTDEIQKLIKQYSNIVYVGMVTENEKYTLIKNAVAVTYISLFEGFGIPILEAMGSGTPVITSDVTSMPEIAGDAAITVNPNHPEDIAKAMSLLANNDTLRQTLIVKGYERKKKFTWSETGNIIYNELTRIAQK
jgi:glycosyltransferase involved in cell wall biosynthesis